MIAIQEAHQREVAAGERFAFGKNWSRFLRNLTVSRIKMAEASLRSSLGLERLDGLSFLDVGSGSGLFSLAARRLGAHVHSFDYDTHSFACTQELKQRYFPGDDQWTVEQGSALDKTYLSRLGTFDIVYSWGVLHHTGSMYEALENLKPLVPLGGRLFISIYNDQGAATDAWDRVKRRYNHLPSPLALAYALAIVGREEARAFRQQLRQRDVAAWLRTWTAYDEISTRGMSRWHDWIDWIGGFPYERATVEQIVDVYAADGFKLETLIDRSTGYGCNEFVFHRVAAAGTFIDLPLPGGTSMARQFGKRVSDPFVRHADGVYGRLQTVSDLPVGAALYLLRDDELVGRVDLNAEEIRLADADVSDSALKRHKYMVVAAEERLLKGPFQYVRGKMWQIGLPDLASLGDSETAPKNSGAYLFENRRQLPLPHATHDEIDRNGAGRFSHWRTMLYFSTLTGSDPNSDGHEYCLLVAATALPADRSFAKLYGHRVSGPFRLREQGWTGSLARTGIDDPPPGLLLLRNDRLAGPAVITGGEILVAPGDASSQDLANADIFLVSATTIEITAPFKNERGHIWSATLADYAHLADDVTRDQSPVFVFEDGRQLPYPHSPHDVIDASGEGRFSHWGPSIWFSTSDNSDPNGNGRRYCVLIAEPDKTAR